MPRIPSFWHTDCVDVTWIPGDADAIVVAAVVVVAALSTGLAVVRRRRSSADRDAAPSGTTAAPPSERPEGSASDAPVEAVAGRFGARKGRLGGGLGKRLASLLSTRTLDEDQWEELEEALLLADVGAAATEDILTQVRAAVGSDVAPRDALRRALIDAVDPSLDRSLAVGAPGDGAAAPVLVVGVNGVGKTTSVGKLARVLVADGYSVVLGAADTFRAAAADQLETWGTRVGVHTERADRDGADPASVAFAAATHAVESHADVVLVDTAGRLQNKAGLMDQLGKISRVVAKVAQPREALLVIDATTGQNGLAQARVFGEAVDLTGIVLTKLDGTAKGGIVVAVQRELGVPVKFVGLGEGVDDLAPFDAEGFVDGLLGD